MKYKVDIHTHTIVSGHAYSTLQENVAEAAKKGMKMIGISEHAPAMPGTCHAFYFQNMLVIPEVIEGVRVLKGVEANIINTNGDIDMDDRDMQALDYVISSLHIPCIRSGSKKENTKTVIRTMKHNRMNIVGHPDDPRFPIDFDEITRAAKENQVLLEINNASLSPKGFRKDAEEQTKQILKYSLKYDHPIILGSDAHVSFDVGNFKYCQKLLEKVNFPEELIINASIDELLSFLKK